MTPAIPRHQAALASEACRSFLADPGLPVPDATAIRRVGSMGRTDFLQTGFLLCEALREAAGLTPDEAVLDIGCGWGRLALPLARHLGPAGRYLGMDAAAEAIAWCRRAIGDADSRFRFHHADIRNSYANPRGRIPASAAVLLPWEERFDLVVATSLFTHLLPDAVERYVREAARLCRPGGRFFATFFLLDEESLRLSAEGRARHRFPAQRGVARIANEEVPEDAVAYPREHVLALLDAAGFDAELLPGAWCGRDGATAFDYQDVILARRRGDAPAGRAGTLGAVEGLSRGRLRGWAWDRGGAVAPLVRVELDGEIVAEARPEHPRRDLPEGGPPVGAPCGFAIALPPRLLDGRPRALRVTAGEEALVLCARDGVAIVDPAEEMLRAWRIEAVSRGAWRIESLVSAEGRLEGLGWAVPPRGRVPAAPVALFVEGQRLPVSWLDRPDPALAAALGLPEDGVRPWFRFALPVPEKSGGRLLRLVLGPSADAPYDPPLGFAVAPGAEALQALDELQVSAALRRHFGRRPTGFARRLDLPADGAKAEAALVAAPEGAADLVLALGLLADADMVAEARRLEALRRACAPGGVAALATAGRGAWIGAVAPAERFLAWRRDGLAEASRTSAHIFAVCGGARFEVVAHEELALTGLRDLVLVRRPAAG
ncbi:MAG: class I SAM-dependent methyltransferase [Acetobacteraceae bacterium]|nr:class I SAM-dependent methyltransferase [Acetobacteraceae bacterium]